MIFAFFSFKNVNELNKLKWRCRCLNTHKNDVKRKRTRRSHIINISYIDIQTEIPFLQLNSLLYQLLRIEKKTMLFFLFFCVKRRNIKRCSIIINLFSSIFFILNSDDDFSYWFEQSYLHYINYQSCICKWYVKKYLLYN